MKGGTLFKLPIHSPNGRPIKFSERHAHDFWRDQTRLELKKRTSKLGPELPLDQQRAYLSSVLEMASWKRTLPDAAGGIKPYSPRAPRR